MNCISFYGVTLNNLLDETNDIKLKVQKKLQEGIELGIVKPFDRYVLTGPCTEEQAIKALKYDIHLIYSSCTYSYCSLL